MCDRDADVEGETRAVKPKRTNVGHDEWKVTMHKSWNMVTPNIDSTANKGIESFLHNAIVVEIH